MIIESVRVQNYRCIKDATLVLNDLTALIGSNGSGKSCFLKALAIFFSEEECDEEDFFANDSAKPIQISVTFRQLGKKELVEFSSYIQDGKLTVTKVVEEDNAKYFGTRRSNPEFTPARKGANATEVRALFDELTKKQEYQKLKNWPYIEGRISQDKIFAALDRWEQENPSGLVPINDNGQFFGYKQVGGWKIGKYCKFVYIPASGDVAKIAVDGGKRSPISILLDISVRNALSSNTELNDLVERTEREYDTIINKSMSKELEEFNTRLTETFSSIAPGNSLDIRWIRGDSITINDPTADVRIIEKGYSTSIQGAGDGSKRALIMTLLQHLAMVQPSSDEDDELDDKANNGAGDASDQNDEFSRGLVIGIEEPELFQHPGRQRNISKLLQRLSGEGIKGVSNSNQIIFSTHSPILIDIDRFEQIRLVRKEDKGAIYGETVIVSTTLKAVNQKILDSKLSKNSPNEDKEKAQLSSFISPEVNEGFFSDLVVLVEGDEDKTALQCTASLMGYDFDEMNIKIVPCESKTSIPKAYAVFNLLAIPTYTIWDSDTAGNCTGSVNMQLQRLVGAGNIVPFPEAIEGRYSCFKENMTTVLQAEVPNYSNLAPGILKRLDLDDRKKNSQKNPLFIRSLFDEAYTIDDKKNGKAPKTIKKIIDQIKKQREQII